MQREITKDLLRQIEITAMVMDDPGRFSEDKLTEIFGCSVQTIRRDFTKLRSEGIAIHTSRGYLHIENKVKTSLLNKFICLYLAGNSNDMIKNLKPIVKKLGNKTLSIFIKIIKAINHKKTISIFYGKNKHGERIKRDVTPIGFNRAAHTFHLIALENDDINNLRFYLFERIADISFRGRKSNVKEFPKLHDIYKFSWNEFTGDSEIMDVELSFDKSCTDGIKDKIFVQEQEFIEESDRLILKLKVKYSYELMAWIMGWGGKVKVLKPAKLRKIIRDTAEEIIRINK